MMKFRTIQVNSKEDFDLQPGDIVVFQSKRELREFNGFKTFRYLMLTREISLQMFEGGKIETGIDQENYSRLNPRNIYWNVTILRAGKNETERNRNK